MMKVIFVKRSAGLALLAAAVLVVGCTGRKPSAAETTESDPEAAVDGVQDLRQVDDPTSLSTEALQVGLQHYMNESGKPAAQSLAELLDRWGLKPAGGAVSQAEADLNGDGTTEVVTTLLGKGSAVTGNGALFILYQSDGGWQVDRSDDVPGPALYAVTDLTGDGLPEVVWGSTESGAHTSFSTVLVSQWKPGNLESLPGDLTMANMDLVVEGQDLLLSGGLIGSVGAGEVQRPRTDRYRFDGQQFQLVDQQYAASEYSYHLLIDGIVAETFGHGETAQQRFRAAMEPGRTVLGDGMVAAEQQEALGEAVRTYARVRLALSLGLDASEAQQVLEEASGPYAGLAQAAQTGTDRTTACQAAVQWAEQNPAFLEALNSPLGYAHPQWLPADLCGPLPPDLA